MAISDKVRQDLVQVVYDKTTGVQYPEGDFHEVILREVDRAAAWVENRIKVSLSVVRATDLPKSPKEAYEDRDRFNSSIDGLWMQFPKWEQLTTAQKTTLYGNNANLYRNGGLPWDMLTEEQRYLFGTNVKYASNKVSEAEKQDGKNTAYIKLYRRPLVTFHTLSLSFVNVPGYQNLNTFFRLYQKNEVLTYTGMESALHIFPAVMARIMNSSQDPLYGSQFGTTAPRIPQVLHIDYEYGFTEVPADLMEAVGIKAAIQILHYISGLFTGGLSGFGVQGFNANFGKGMMYEPLKMQLESDLQQILRPWYSPVMTGW